MQFTLLSFHKLPLKKQIANIYFSLYNCYNNVEKIIVEDIKMDKYVCPCTYEYDPAVGDPENGVPAGTPWEEVPADWVCPWCGLGKEAFEKQ